MLFIGKNKTKFWYYMRKVSVKIPAKINLTLDVVGVKNGFHMLKTLVTSVSVYDKVTVRKRADDLVTLSFKGLQPTCAVEDNNAYKTARLFMQKFNVNGVDIVINKAIPLCGGMGGSSADIAGVLKAMQRLYGIKQSVNDLASTLGSDAEYMLNGGFAVLQGKGEIVTPVKTKANLYLLLIKEEEQKAKLVTAKDCYKKFDEMAIQYPSQTETAVQFLQSKDYGALLGVLKNDLYPVAKKLLPEIEVNLNALKEHGNAVMTGSGATVVGVYLSASKRNNVYKQLKAKYGKRLIKARVVNK